MEKGYYIVGAKCGHVSRGYYILIDFAVEASSAKQAAQKVRWFPRVKHDHKDAIKYVRAVTKNEFDKKNEKNINDPYLNCKNIQQQKKIPNINERLIKEDYTKFSHKRCVEYKQKKIQLYIESINKKFDEYLYS